MRTARIAMTALLLAPTALGAEELEIGVSTRGSWNDNVFGVSEDAQRGGEDEDPVDDFSLRVSPFVRVRDPDGELMWSLRYQPSYERYLEQSEVSGFDHVLVADASWRFAERWNFTLREAYALYQNSIRFNEAAEPGQEATSFRNEEIRSNRTSAVLSHALTPRDSLFLSLNYNSFEYPDAETEDTRSDDRSVPSAALAYQHTLSERTTAGLRFSWIQQAHEGSGGDEDETQFYNLAGTLEHRLSRTFRVEASAGPTFVDTSPVETAAVGVRSIQFPVLPFLIPDPLDPQGQAGPFAVDANDCRFDGVPGRASLGLDGCALDLGQEITPGELATLSGARAEVPRLDERGNPLDTGDSGGTDLTYFARLALIKDWERWTGSLSYQRSNSENARFGSSSVADTISGSLSWKPRLLWRVDLSAAASWQEQVSDQPVAVAFQLANVPAPAGVTSVPQVAEVQGVVFSNDSNSLQFRTQSVSLAVIRQLTRHASVNASVFWYAQEQDAVSGGATRWNNLTLWIGFDWAFEPIRF